VIYTLLLKRHTSQSTLWGGACGAAPVLIAWAAATGTVPAPAWLLFGVVFFWQPPHFWALAIKYRDDYRSAGIPMLPVVASVRRVLAESIVYSWLMVAVSLAVWPWAGAGSRLWPERPSCMRCTGSSTCRAAWTPLAPRLRTVPRWPMAPTVWSRCACSTCHWCT
jgi:4-hydroxybenzoate polyprenyltransferase